mgnify:CR=1 FL=1
MRSPTARWARPVPALVAATLAVAGCGGPSSHGRGAPAAAAVAIPEPYEIDATGNEYVWRYTYPGADGRLDTADDVATTTDLHVPVGVPVRLRLHSLDYVYFFGVPHLELKQIAVPDLEFDLAWTSTDVGTFELLGDQMCGRPHASLDGQLVVMPRDAYAAWLGDLDLAADIRTSE